MTNKEDRDIEVAALNFLDSIASPSAPLLYDEVMAVLKEKDMEV